MSQAVVSRRRISWGVLVVGLMLSAGCSLKSAKRWNTGSREPGQTGVFLMLGVGDLDGSEGMDQLAKIVRANGPIRLLHHIPGTFRLDSL
jgi:hypothetical protein